MELRRHQEEAKAAIIASLEGGSNATLASLATGAGKTEIGLSVLAAAFAAGASGGLWIAHRRELVEEPRDRVKRHWSDQLPIPGIVMADYDEIGQSPFLCTSIQTLYSQKRLDRVLTQPISHIIYDEVHHIVAKRNLGVVRAIQEAYPDVKLVGLTATPKRADGDGLSRVFDSVAFKYPLQRAIKDGVLVPFVAMVVELSNTSFKDVKKTVTAESDEKEYNATQSVAAMQATNAHELIFEGWHQVAHDRSTIIFTPDVSYAHYLAAYWRDQGYTAVAVDGTTPKAERDQIKVDFRNGLIQVICNCAVYTEGFDAAIASCAVIARPVGSDSLYLQMAGRVLRTFPGKSDAIILDCLPKDARDVRMAGDLLGKPKEQRKAEDKAEKSGVISAVFGINRHGEGIDGDPDKVVMRVLNYLSEQSSLAWLYVGDIATVAIDDGVSLAIVFPQEGRYELARQQVLSSDRKDEWETRLKYVYRRLNDDYNVWLVQGSKTVWLGSHDTWEGVSDIAEEYASEHKVHKLAGRDQNWRKQKVSPKQLNFLRQLGIEADENMSKGEAAQAITHQKTISILKEKRVIV